MAKDEIATHEAEQAPAEIASTEIAPAGTETADTEPADTEPADTETADLATRRTADGRFIEQLVRPALAVELGLEPHPEGGWYRRTWTSPVEVALAEPDGTARVRPAATLIQFLLPVGEASAWHRVSSTEIWIWNGRGTVMLEFGGSGPIPVTTGIVALGGDLTAGEHAQVTIAADIWQRTLPSTTDALVSCVVSPGFDFADFSMVDVATG